jgi:hypothetical protein
VDLQAIRTSVDTRTKSLLETITDTKESTSVEIESVSEHHGVPKEKAAVETFGALKEQYGD